MKEIDFLGGKPAANLVRFALPSTEPSSFMLFCMRMEKNCERNIMPIASTISTK